MASTTRIIPGGRPFPGWTAAGKVEVGDKEAGVLDGIAVAVRLGSGVGVSDGVKVYAAVSVSLAQPVLVAPEIAVAVICSKYIFIESSSIQLEINACSARSGWAVSSSLAIRSCSWTNPITSDGAFVPVM